MAVFSIVCILHLPYCANKLKYISTECTFCVVVIGPHELLWVGFVNSFLIFYHRNTDQH